MREFRRIFAPRLYDANKVSRICFLPITELVGEHQLSGPRDSDSATSSVNGSRPPVERVRILTCHAHCPTPQRRNNWSCHPPAQRQRVSNGHCNGCITAGYCGHYSPALIVDAQPLCLCSKVEGTMSAHALSMQFGPSAGHAARRCRITCRLSWCGDGMASLS
jgi:hypothetical protein